MSFILSFLTGPGGLYALLTAAIGVALLWARRSGVKATEAKQAKRDAKAREERHEMDREADDVERRTKDLTDDEARKEALKWAKR